MASSFSFYRVLVRGNLFVGFCAWSLFQALSLLFQDKILLSPASILIFCGTVLYYTFHSYEQALNYSSLRTLIRSMKSVSIPFPESVILIVLSVLALVVVSLMEVKIVLLFFGLSIPCLFYSIPIVRIRGRYSRLREFNKLKIILVSLTWALAAVLLPLAESGISVPAWQLILRLMSITFFVYALCIPFEIRDQLNDRGTEGNFSSEGSATVPAVSQAFIALFLSAVSTTLLFVTGIDSSPVFIAQLTVLLLTMILLMKMPDKPSDFFCRVLVDGMMILYFLMVFISLKYHEILS